MCQELGSKHNTADMVETLKRHGLEKAAEVTVDMLPERIKSLSQSA